MEKKSFIKINSFNCRGLRNKQKRTNIFSWLQKYHYGITLLQETHSIPNDEQIWKKEWDGQIFFSHGLNHSRGVAILIPQKCKLNVEVLSEYRDTEGRILLVECSVEQNNFIIINVYSPTKDKHHEQLLFLSNLKNIVNQYSDKALIIGGDFNTYLDVTLDKMGGTAEKRSTYSEKLKSFCEEFSLVDIFRVRNKNQIFTRREFTKSGFIQSRLDYWFTSIQLEYLIQNTSIQAGNSSDHSIISLDLELVGTQKRGKGLWKFNNNLLTDPDYVGLIKTLITDIKTNVNFENKNTL